MSGRRSSARGLTLIEIMIVILIMGILLVILLPKMVNTKYQSQWSACVQYERNLAAALESYNAQNNSYPDTLSRLTSAAPVFITAVPKCPSNGVSYGGAYTPTLAAGTTSTFDTYTLFCPGVHFLVMTTVLQGYPQYNPARGMLQYDSTH